MFRNMILFTAPRSTPKLEDHPLSAVRDCLFNIFATTLHFGGRSSIRNLRMRHAVVTGAPLLRGSVARVSLSVLSARNCSLVVEVIPQRFQLQAQVTLASLGWCPKWGECTGLVFLHSERWTWYSCAYVVAAITWPKLQGRSVCKTHAEGCRGKWWGLCGRNPAVLYHLSFAIRKSLHINSAIGVFW